MGARHSVTNHLSSDAVLWSVSEQILQTRSIAKGTRSIAQSLIQWSNLPRSLATWEDLEFLRQQFPRTTIWDRLGAQGRGSVTTGPSTVPRPAQESEEGAQDSGLQLRRSSRPKLPNQRITGEEWTTV